MYWYDRGSLEFGCYKYLFNLLDLGVSLQSTTSKFSGVAFACLYLLHVFLFIHLLLRTNPGHLSSESSERGIRIPWRGNAFLLVRPSDPS